MDVVYVPQPNSELCNSEIVGKKFRNKIELRKHFGTKYDTSLLDFKTGKVSQLAWRRQRRMKNLANTNNYASAAKYDTYLNVPVRQNTSVLKTGVFCITNNHKNEPTPASVLNTTTPAIGPNGQPMKVAYYDNGKLHGDFRKWYDNGQLMEEAHYSNGSPRGNFKRWNQDGQEIFNHYY